MSPGPGCQIWNPAPGGRLESTSFLWHHGHLVISIKKESSMASSLGELNPRLLWKHFAKILTIPHCSGNEKALGGYVMSVANSLYPPCKRDKVGNVLVSKPA